MDYTKLLAVAIAEACLGLAGRRHPHRRLPVRCAGPCPGPCGHNRRVQQDDPSVHGETDAFRNAGRVKTYRDKIMVTTLAPCWYCSGLIRQFNIGAVVVGEAVNFRGGIDWLANGVTVIDLHNEECIQMLAEFTQAHPELWS